VGTCVFTNNRVTNCSLRFAALQLCTPATLNGDTLLPHTLSTKPLIFGSTQALSQAAAKFVSQLSEQAIAARGRFTVALSGGSLPRLISEPLIAEPLRSRVNWSAWHVFWADERCVPLDHPDSNYRLARVQLFDHVPIPANQIYPINETLPPAAAAAAYQDIMAQVFQLGRPYPRFDLILLGMGEDGHTASLFPRHPLLSETNQWVAPIFDSPKPPPTRITLTLPVINQAEHVVFISTGAGKAGVLPLALGADTEAGLVPARLVQPQGGQLAWFVDEAAAQLLKTETDDDQL